MKILPCQLLIRGSSLLHPCLCVRACTKVGSSEQSMHVLHPQHQSAFPCVPLPRRVLSVLLLPSVERGQTAAELLCGINQIVSPVPPSFFSLFLLSLSTFLSALLTPAAARPYPPHASSRALLLPAHRLWRVPPAERLLFQTPLLFLILTRR